MASKAAGLQPLQELLDSVLGRLEALEGKVGIESTSSPKTKVLEAPADVQDDPPAVKAYDEYMEKSVAPLVNSCKDLGEMEKVGGLLKDAWVGIRTIIVLASRSKMPSEIPAELSPHLKPVQTALEAIRKLRLDRKFDWHLKAIMEMATCLSWILIKPPPQAPVAFCKEGIASSVFWSNKIRKEFKGKDDKQIAFCDALKVVGNDLVAYITEYHKTGLTWNPRGVPLAETVAVLESSAPDETPPSPKRKVAVVGEGAGVNNLMAELEKKRTSDGSSAATGLKKVGFVV